MKNCDLTLTTPALLKSLLVAYAGSLVRRRKGGGGEAVVTPTWKGDTWLKKKIKPLKRPMWVRLRLKRGQTREIAKGKQSS